MKSKGILKICALMLMAAVLLSAKSSQFDNVIKGKLSFLLGDYDFLSNDDGQKNILKPEDYPDKYSLKITKKNLVLFKNGEMTAKYPFSAQKLSILDDGTYVMFMKDGEYYPMFYKNDKVSVHIFPEMYIDNYYIKRKE